MACLKIGISDRDRRIWDLGPGDRDLADPIVLVLVLVIVIVIVLVIVLVIVIDSESYTHPRQARRAVPIADQGLQSIRESTSGRDADSDPDSDQIKNPIGSVVPPVLGLPFADCRLQWNASIPPADSRNPSCRFPDEGRR
jgi:hypothetical protein